MKKSLVLILLFAFVFSAFFVSCGNGETEKETTPEDTTKEKSIEIIVDGNDNVVNDPFDIETEAESEE